MKKDLSKDRTRAYRERLVAKREAAAEAAEEIAKMKLLDLRFFGESAYGQNAAQSSREEIQIHKQFLALFVSRKYQGRLCISLPKECGPHC